jgi:hypothetical protein
LRDGAPRVLSCAVIYYLVRILHLVAMALWLGAALWVPGDVRRTLALGAPHLAALPSRIRPALRINVWAGAATIVSGIALAGLARSSRLGIVIGFALALVLFILDMTIVLPAGKRIAAAIEAGGGELSDAQRLSKSLSAFSGVGHLLWLAALLAMVLPY